MSSIPPNDPTQPRYTTAVPPVTQPPVQYILQPPPSAFGRYGRWLIGALVLCVIALIGQHANYENYFSPPGGPQERYFSLSKEADKKIAIIKIEGAILDPEGYVKQQLDRVREDKDVVAMVLRIDSPGGTVTASDYLYHRIQELAEDRQLPVVVSMGGICASGGYYLAMAAGPKDDVIFAEPTTWTGSIGVLIPHYDLSGLLHRWDVKDDSVASNKDKLMGSPTRELTPDERADERKLLQELVDRSFDRFKQIVADGRPKMKADDKNFAKATTGQIFTAEQAHELGMVDKIGFIEDAIDRAADLAGVDDVSVRAVKYDEPPNALKSLLGANSPLAPASGRSELQVLLELATPRAYYLSTTLPALLGNTH